MDILKRGIIVSHTSGISFQDKPELREPPVTETELMNYAFYWDQILMPFNIVLHPIKGDESYIKEGILQYKFGGGFSGMLTPENIHKNNMEALIKCYEEHRFPNTPFDWTIHNRVSSPFIANDKVVEKNIIRVKFNSLLPIPSQFVTADKILEFKEKNQSSLQNLHNHIFDIYVRISNISDPDIRSIYEQQLFNEFEESLKEYKSAFQSKFKNPLLMPLTADIKSCLMEAGEMVLGQNISIKGTLEIGKNILSIFSTKQNIPKAVTNNTTLRYIGEAIQQGVISQF
ncbi:DUF6236 family protein [Acinetobacter baumannii]|nr:DUF6236 family protein [Acinetobacter baumannii]